MVPRSEYCIENMHDEVLVTIFGYLSGNDLKRVMLTCRLFNDIVGFSSKLMEKLMLKITSKRNWNLGVLLDCQRKFQHLRIKKFTASDNYGPVFQCFLDVVKNVKTFELHDSHINFNDLQEMIVFLPKMTQFELVNVKIMGELNIVEDQQLPALDHLKIVKIIDSDLCFEIFEKARNLTGICLQYDDCRRHENINLTSLEVILCKQKHLKSLEIFNIRYSNLFDRDFVDEIPFQLDNLTLSQCYFKNKDNFDKFIERQQELQEVELAMGNLNLKLDRLRYFEDLLLHVFRLKKLNHFNLEIKNYQFMNENHFHYGVSENLTSLTCSLEQTCKLNSVLKVFPNLKSLELKAKQLKTQEIEFLNNNLVKLEHLKVVNFSSDVFQQLKFKNLKSISIFETNIEPKDWDQFIINNPGITKLVINYTFFMDLSEAMIDKLTSKWNLEHFELIDKYIGLENDIYKMICNNCKNLKYLKLWNVNIEKDFDEADKDYLKSRNIQFHLFNDETLNTPIVPF